MGPTDAHDHEDLPIGGRTSRSLLAELSPGGARQPLSPTQSLLPCRPDRDLGDRNVASTRILCTTVLILVGDQTGAWLSAPVTRLAHRLRCGPLTPGPFGSILRGAVTTPDESIRVTRIRSGRPGDLPADDQGRPPMRRPLYSRLPEGYAAQSALPSDFSPGDLPWAVRHAPI